ncbi:MAG: maleylpyruvate isomerase family mycothiol-dependent enzyme [Streptosporangiaceae bacterium]
MISEWIAADRRDLAGVLDGLTAAQWDAPSLCDGWAVRHVVAHLTMPLRYSPPRFLLRLAAAGGSFRKMSDGVARRDGELPRAQLIATLRDRATYPWKPPGGGLQASLTHQVVHGLDITAALGAGRRIPDEAMAAVLGSVTGPQSMKHFGVDLSGVQLQATDLDWSRGQGAPLRGTAADLVLLATGRRLPDGALSGPGELRTGGARR